MGRGLLSLVVILCAAPARADDAFDASTGRIDLARADFGFGFEYTGAGLFPGVLTATTESGTGEPSELFVADPAGLEGAGALALGLTYVPGQVHLAALGADFAGRRVELRLWYRPLGTDLIAWLEWYTPQPWPDRVGLLALTPTGRATSDGWVELTSGAFDWSLGATIAPAVLTLIDGYTSEAQVFGAYPTYAYDSTARVLVDALSIEDLGPAAASGAPCTLIAQDTACGGEAICFLGRCTDPAPVLSITPYTHEQRLQVLARSRLVRAKFAGARISHAAHAAFESALDGLVDATPRRWYPGLARAWELLVDGHSRPPGIGPVVGVGIPLCLGAGVADLLPGSPVLPLVFASGAEDFGLRVGDALVAIDGVDAESWLEAAADWTYYSGDPANRMRLLAFDLGWLAARTGAVLTFQRCPTAVPCASPEIVTLDLGEQLAGVLGGEEPAWWTARYATECLRRIENLPSDQFAVFDRLPMRDDGDIRVLQLHGFPDTDLWLEGVDQAFTDVHRLLIDQRTGLGGYVRSVEYFARHALPASQSISAYLIPNLALTDARLTELDVCMSDTTLQDSLYCANGLRMDLQGPDYGPGSDAPIALISGVSISGNDYLAAALARRAAPTRHFGFGPTWGAFGHLCLEPPAFGQFSYSSFQCADTFFTGADGLPAAETITWMSGTGIAPDEVLVQRQSDAMQGVDTHIEAAKAWLVTQ